MEAVASQPPVVSEAAAVATPVAGGAALTALPSVVQDLARFFLILFEPVRILFPGGNWRHGGGDCLCSGVGGVLRARRLLLGVQSPLVLRL